MNKTIRIIILIAIAAFLLYNYYSRFRNKPSRNFYLNKDTVISHEDTDVVPKIALIFDNLGKSVRILRSIYSLKVPLSVSVIPGLKFSRNVAYIAKRCGYSVIVHLPLEPKDSKYRAKKYQFISSSLSGRDINKLLRYYLDYIRIAVGVNAHMGSNAEEDIALMKTVLKAIKERGLIFIDSRKSMNSAGFALARRMGIKSAYNEGFLDSSLDKKDMINKINELINIAKNKGKIIVIVYPGKETIDALKKEIPKLKKKVSFITVEEYFGM